MIAQERRSGLPGARSQLAILQRLAKRLGDVAGWPYPQAELAVHPEDQEESMSSPAGCFGVGLVRLGEEGLDVGGEFGVMLE
jgi:hypothetical protein